MCPLPGSSGGSELEAQFYNKGAPGEKCLCFVKYLSQLFDPHRILSPNSSRLSVEGRSRACGPHGPFPRPVNTFSLLAVLPLLLLRFGGWVNRNRHAGLTAHATDLDNHFNVADGRVFAQNQVDLVEAGQTGRLPCVEN